MTRLLGEPQLAQAYDDAADMLIRLVQRIHHKAKELMQIRQATYLQLGCLQT